MASLKSDVFRDCIVIKSVTVTHHDNTYIIITKGEITTIYIEDERAWFLKDISLI